jgi:16S rRNA (cytidine1402-2'-O)-methyltransferase
MLDGFFIVARLPEYGIKRLTESTLFVVATPIGNLDDLSPRARQILEEADLIAAEDTRHTRRLLSHFGIKSRLLALHEHNEEALVAGLIDKLTEGQSIALVSDAGTPLISDPGYRLLRAAHESGIRVSPVPGPSALLAALSVAGLPTDRFCFEGFLPAKQSARRKRLQALAEEPRTIVCFESVHRIADCLDDLSQTFGAGRQAFVGREISKLHEQCVSGTLRELQRMLDEGQIAQKGEFVLAVAGQAATATTTVNVDPGQLLRELAAVLPGSQAVDIVSSLTGMARNETYRLMLSQGDGTEEE